MRFFLLAPYDFGASSKIIKMGGKISGEFPFNFLLTSEYFLSHD